MKGTVGCGVLELAATERCATERCAKGRSGVVSAVFRNSAHLLAGDTVITVGSFKTGNHPYTVNLPQFPGSITTGSPFFLDGGSLIIGSVCRIPLGNCRPFRPKQRIGSPAGKSKIFSSLKVAEEERRMSEPLKSGSVFERAIRKAMSPGVRLIERGIRYKDKRSLLEGSEKLAGLGAGLTPSGDDFLVGIISASRFHRLSGGKKYSPDNAILERIAKAASNKTTVFSGMLLRCAAKGWYSDLVADWLAAIHKGDAESAKVATRRLVAVGHTSGRDTLSGLLMAVRSLLSFQ